MTDSKPHSERCPSCGLSPYEAGIGDVDISRIVAERNSLIEQLETLRAALQKIDVVSPFDHPARAIARTALLASNPTTSSEADGRRLASDLPDASDPASSHPTLDDRNPASVVGVPWNEQGYAGDPDPAKEQVMDPAEREWMERRKRALESAYEAGLPRPEFPPCAICGSYGHFTENHERHAPSERRASNQETRGE